MSGNRLMETWIDVGLRENFDTSRIEKALDSALGGARSRAKITPALDVKNIDEFRRKIAELHKQMLELRGSGTLASLVHVAGKQFELKQARLQPEAAASAGMAAADLQKHQQLMAATRAAQDEEAKRLQLRLQNAERAREVDAERLRIILNINEALDEQVRKGAAVTAQEKAANATASQGIGARMMSKFGGSGTQAGMMAAQASYAIQDFAAVLSGTGDFGMAMMGAANNLSMIAMLAGGPVAGAITGLATAVLPMLFKSLDTGNHLLEIHKNNLEVITQRYEAWRASVDRPFDVAMARQGVSRIFDVKGIQERQEDLSVEKQARNRRLKELNDQAAAQTEIINIQRTAAFGESHELDGVVLGKQQIENLKEEIKLREEKRGKIESDAQAEIEALKRIDAQQAQLNANRNQATFEGRLDYNKKLREREDREDAKFYAHRRANDEIDARTAPNKFARERQQIAKEFEDLNDKDIAMGGKRAKDIAAAQRRELDRVRREEEEHFSDIGESSGAERQRQRIRRHFDQLAEEAPGQYQGQIAAARRREIDTLNKRQKLEEDSLKAEAIASPFERRRAESRTKFEAEQQRLQETYGEGNIPASLQAANQLRFQREQKDIAREETRHKGGIMSSIAGSLDKEAGQRFDVMNRLKDRIDDINKTFSGPGQDAERQKMINLAGAAAQKELANIGPKTTFSAIADLNKMIQSGIADPGTRYAAQTAKSVQQVQADSKRAADNLDQIVQNGLAGRAA